MKETGDHSYLNCSVDRLNPVLRRDRVRKVILGREHKAIAK